jgi:hypothetical protein
MLDQAADLGQLVRPVHLRVAGKDLLDQGRARSWQAHDEDRRRVRVAGVRMPREERLVERAADALVDHLRLNRVVLLERAPRPVALLEVRECTRVVATVLVRLAEREAELYARLGRLCPGELPLHRRDLGVVEAEGLEVRQAPPGLAVLRAQLHGPAVGRDRIGLAADRLQRVAKAKPGAGRPRVQRGGAA